MELTKKDSKRATNAFIKEVEAHYRAATAENNKRSEALLVNLAIDRQVLEFRLEADRTRLESAKIDKDILQSRFESERLGYRSRPRGMTPPKEGKEDKEDKE